MAFRAAMSVVADQVVIDSRDGVLPQLGFGDPRAEVARDRAHVAVQQLEPGPREGVGELVGVLVEALRDRRVDRIHLQGEIRRQHHRRVPLRRILGVGHLVLRGGVRGRPLLRAGRAGGQLPLVAVQVVEEPVVPPRRLVGPRTLEPAGDRVGADAGAEGALPADALRLDGAALRFGPDQIGVASAVALAERVATDDERDRLLVVHRHASERLADVDRGGDRVRVAVRSFGVDVDETHLHGAERAAELALTAVPLVAEPRVLGAPDDLVGLPDVGSPEPEAEGLEPHRLHRAVAGEDQEIRPGDRAAVLLLDRPQQSPGLVEVGVVGPAVERGEALRALAAAAPAVRDPVGAGGVPRHPDEERAVVAVVGGPPVLRRRHHVEHVPLQRVDVDGCELRGVVEVVVERARVGRVLVENLQVQLIRPPVPVRHGPTRLRGGGRDRWVLALAAVFGHGGPPRAQASAPVDELDSTLVGWAISWWTGPQQVPRPVRGLPGRVDPDGRIAP